MYVSRVELRNWRSYADCVFEFPEPTPGKPLVLVGAMNGHGKTSFLLAFYFGLFGRFGVRYAEGFDLGPDAKPIKHYRQALEEFRREGAPVGESTEVDLTITPSPVDLEELGGDAVEIRIVRRWHFTSAGRWREKDEEVQVYVDGFPQALDHIDDAESFIDRFFVPAHVLPAFFFDGEQAGRRIDEAGESQMRDAIQVLYGTKLLEELDTRLQEFVRLQRSKMHLNAKDKRQQRLADMRGKRDSLTGELALLEAEHRAVLSRLQESKDAVRGSQEHLERLGATSRREMVAMREEAELVATNWERASAAFNKTVADLPLAMVMGRFGEKLSDQLDSEEELDRWKLLQAASASHAPTIAAGLRDKLNQAGNVEHEVVEQAVSAVESLLKSSFAVAPKGASNVMKHPHLDVARRAVLVERLRKGPELSHSEVTAVTKTLGDLGQRRERIKIRSNEDRQREQVQSALDELDHGQTEVARLASESARLEMRTVSLREELVQTQQEVSRIAALLKDMGPFEAMLEVAERVRDVLTDFNEALQPLALARLEEAVSAHFRAIADVRYADSRIRLGVEGKTVVETPTGIRPLRVMSGYERRSFGIAFSLALAEVSGFRAPLIIDTPLGNADSSYRTSLLKHLVNCGLDQVIILTHDEEVTGVYRDAIQQHVNQHFLIENAPVPGAPQSRESRVHVGAYFGDI